MHEIACLDWKHIVGIHKTDQNVWVSKITNEQLDDHAFDTWYGQELFSWPPCQISL
jgi:hypothetical protein